MSKSTILDPSTVRPFQTSSMDYHAALALAEQQKISVSQVQADHQAAEFVASGATPSLQKLNSQQAKLVAELAEVRSKQAEQALLAGQWETLLCTRDELKRRISNTEQELSDIIEEIDGRARFVRQCVGEPQSLHGGIGRYGALMQIVAGLKLAKVEVESVLPEIRADYASQLEKITAFAKANGINN